MARIVVEVVGKDSGATATLNNASEAAIKTGQAAEKVGQSFYVAGQKITTSSKNIVAQVTMAGAATAKLANEAKKSAAQLGGSVVQGSNQAANALTNLGRVAQDAPFGFIGIQNNLNPLLESFQRLKVETGSNAKAIKALGASLIGPAGLGIALSVVSAGILFYQQYQQRANKTVVEAKKAADEYANSLNQVDRAQLVGAQSAAKETTTLSLLYKQYQNSSLSLDQRKSAYEELQKLYPAYFGNIKFEQEASDKTKAAYERLTTSILATARARAAADLITKNSQRQLENEQKLIDLGTAANKAKEASDKALRAAKGAGGELGQAKADLALNDALKDQADIQKQINNLVTDSILLRDKNLQLEKSATSEIEKGGTLTETNTKTTEKSVKTIQDVLNALSLGLKKVNNDLTITFGEANKKRIGEYQKAISELTEMGTGAANSKIKELQGTIQSLSTTTLKGLQEGVKNTNKELQTTPIIPVETFKTGFRTVLTEAEKFRNSLNDIIKQGTFETFSDFGSSLGEAFANGGNIISAASSSILSGIGGIIVQFGKLTLAAGIASTALGKALTNPFNPGSGLAAIGAGIALIAIGSAVKGFSSKVGKGGEYSNSNTYEPRKRTPGFAGGVTNFEGGLAYVHAGEMLTNLPTGANVIPRAKTDRILNGMSGGGSIEVYGRLSGQDILLSSKRTASNNKNI